MDPVDNGRLGYMDEPAFIQNILAQISNYTDRPDLLLAEIERHDPGFIKRMNAASERESAQEREARFRFGRIQAYTALSLSAASAVAILGSVFFAIHMGKGFGTIIALAIFYAVTQGGSHGFLRIVEAVRQMIARTRDRDGTDA